MSRIQKALKKAGDQRTPNSRVPAVTLDFLSGSREGDNERYQRDFIMIGRGHRNDVALDLFEDRSVSSRHAGIKNENDGIYLYDFGSLNGTFLNGIPVDRARVDDGDEIQLGRLGPRLRLNFSRQLNLDTATGALEQPVIPLDEESRLFDEGPEIDELETWAGRRQPSNAYVWRTRLLAVVVALLGIKIGLDLMRALT